MGIKEDIDRTINILRRELNKRELDLSIIEEEIKEENALRPTKLYVPGDFEKENKIELINRKDSLEQERDKIEHEIQEQVLNYFKIIIY